jgi:hypothetical protein
MIVFASIQVHETRASLFNNPDIWARVKPFVIVTPCIIAASWLPLMWFAYKLYYEFGCVVRCFRLRWVQLTRITEDGPCSAS